jgi:hypothetical protein
MTNKPSSASAFLASLALTGRWILLALILVGAMLYPLMALTGVRPKAYEAFRLLAELTVFAAAAVMGHAAATQFSRGERARLTWMLISLGAALFFLADVGIYLPSAAGLWPGANWALLVAVSAITSSRILLVWALWGMVKVYRDSALGFRLLKRDYATMVIFGLLNLLTVFFGANSIRYQLSGSGPELIHWVLIICLPLPVGLILCSVLAVMIWRYSQQMGGGLVAKAWRSVLLYLVLLPTRTVLVGLGAYVLARGSHWAWVIGEVSYLGLALAVWSLHLGASYQYEACTQAVTSQLDYSSGESAKPAGRRDLNVGVGEYESGPAA